MKQRSAHLVIVSADDLNLMLLAGHKLIELR